MGNSFYSTKAYNIRLSSLYEKCVREILVNIMPQIKHNACGAHIINLISNALVSLSSFDIVKQLLAAIKNLFYILRLDVIDICFI